MNLKAFIIILFFIHFFSYYYSEHNHIVDNYFTLIPRYNWLVLL